MHGGLLLNGFAADQMKAEPKDKQCAYPLDHAINNSVFVESHNVMLAYILSPLRTLQILWLVSMLVVSYRTQAGLAN